MRITYKIVIIDEAKLDYKKSLKWYKDINPKLADRFNTSFKESLALIKKNPLHFQIRYNDVRLIMITKFPYLIHFTVYENLIVIKAIYHSSRDSKLNLQF
ncbi:type II toxin-antitoxin system RelE/ParE family toxin [Flavobacterium sp. SUN052]|uniref:type II toxin-antitoxin system RelE/ParE family toxin n=1 Tax=Flavobacterium sp. SUN052 TaxID=3002441 RepID=UPI00237E46FB|nr:type II toxin-antitoxin system RelE/ParE family toxin [Flavobacterium sp. SUN052]MEC4003865.1 type II toxin-antitoxin system RelE/ParE family toxin [Flavobacterium sp. SUN052]